MKKDKLSLTIYSGLITVILFLVILLFIRMVGV